LIVITKLKKEEEVRQRKLNRKGTDKNDKSCNLGRGAKNHLNNRREKKGAANSGGDCTAAREGLGREGRSNKGRVVHREGESDPKKGLKGKSREVRFMEGRNS